MSYKTYFISQYITQHIIILYLKFNSSSTVLINLLHIYSFFLLFTDSPFTFSFTASFMLLLIFSFSSISILNHINIYSWGLGHVTYWCSTGKFPANFEIFIFVSMEAYLEFHIDSNPSYFKASWSETCNKHFFQF